MPHPALFTGNIAWVLIGEIAWGKTPEGVSCRSEDVGERRLAEGHLSTATCIPPVSLLESLESAVQHEHVKQECFEELQAIASIALRNVEV